MTDAATATSTAWLTSIGQSTDLHALTQIVRKGRETAIEVVVALRRIRDAKLYKQTHSSWESWCQDNWWTSKRHADRQISALAVVRELGHGVPIGGRVAEALARVTPEARAQRIADAKAIREASGKSGPPSNRDLLQVVGRNADPMLTAQADPDSDERFTPKEWADLAREVMGAIDLDPASCNAANNYVLAERIFTVQDDGLEHEWNGRVFLNPPYSQPLMASFVGKLLAEIGAKRVRQAVCLTNAAPASSWWQTLAVGSDCVFFPARRINFINGGDRNRFDSCFFYFGQETKAFRRVFGDRGVCGRMR